jgi:hypothetical protein
VIISLIQALYDPRIPIPHDWDNYEKVLEDIEFFAISPQIYYLLKQQDQLAQTPSFFQARLKQNYDETLLLNIFIKHQTEQIFRGFEEKAIPAIPLKGVSFAEIYYGHIGARGTSDIDLLIKKADVEKAIECVKALGFTKEQERSPSNFHWGFSKPLPHSPIPLTVELHWDVLNENTSDLRIAEFWNQAMPLQSYRYIKELSDFHTFYMICLHGWRHKMNALKYFIDIIQMVHVLQDQLQYTELFKAAATHRTLKRITRTLSIVYHHFPHLEWVIELPFPNRAYLWWDYNAIRNLDRRTIKQYVNLIYYEFFDFDTVKHSFAALINRILLALKKNLMKRIDST